MNINGHGLLDHLRLIRPLLVVIAAIWALRLILAAAGAPHLIIHLASVSVTMPVCMMLAVLIIHVRRFGGYANVVFITFLLVLWAELLISAAIAFTVLTGLDTVYSAPEYSFGIHNPWRHVAGHMTLGLGMGTLIGTAMSCLLFWMLRRLPADADLAKRR